MKAVEVVGIHLRHPFSPQTTNYRAGAGRERKRESERDGPGPGPAQIITYPLLRAAPVCAADKVGSAPARVRPRQRTREEERDAFRPLSFFLFLRFFTITIIAAQIPGVLCRARKERARLSAGAGKRFGTSFIHALPLPVMRAGGSFRPAGFSSPSAYYSAHCCSNRETRQKRPPSRSHWPAG